MCKHIIFCFLVLCNTAIAQNVIHGSVTDASSGEALIGVLVFVSETQAAATNADGRYILQALPGNYIIRTKIIGYSEAQQNITVGATDTLVVNFKLRSIAQELGTVVVSAGRFEQRLEEVTVSMEVIKPSLVENNNEISLDGAVAKVPGVTIINGQVNIRGGSGFSYGAGSRVLVMVDDMPMLAADAGDVKWSFLPLENMEQIEIIKGASSALFGSSAMNGVINVRTAYAKENPVTKANLYTGFYEAPRLPEAKWWGKNTQVFSGGSFLHAQKFNRLDFVFSGNYMKNDGYREAETEERHRVGCNLRYRFNDIEGLSAGINSTYMNTRGGNYLIWADDTAGAYKPLGGYDTAGSSISNYNTIRYHIDPYITYITKSGFTFKLRSRYFRTSNFNDTQQEAFANLYYGEFLVQKHFEKINATISTGGVIIDGDVTGSFYGYREMVNRSFYTQFDKKFIRRLNVSLGVRNESFKFTYNERETRPIFRTGVNYEIAPGSNARASYGQGYRFPSIAEKYIRTQVGPIVVYPNDSIVSETGWTWEIGYRQILAGKTWKGYIDIALFWSRYRNMMEFTFGSYGKPFIDPFFGLGFKSVNIGNTQVNGFEISSGVEGFAGSLPVSLIAGYTYIEPYQRDFVDSIDAGKNTANYNVLKYRFRHLFKLDASVEIKKFELGCDVRYISYMESIDEVFNSLISGVEHFRDEHKKGDWVCDARLAFNIDSNFKAMIISKNIFNRMYVDRPANMQATRSYSMQLSIAF